MASFSAVAHATPSCTAVADAKSSAVLIKEGNWSQCATPASTFKIALSLMGYDAGILIDGHSPALPFREGVGGAAIPTVRDCA
jgi:beta-lactamase class D